MAIRHPTFTQRLMAWAGESVARAMWAGRTRKSPERESMAYAKLMSIGGQRYSQDRPMVKPTPANLRRFSKTVYARRAINRVKNAVASLKWEVAAKPGIKGSSVIKSQIETVTMCLNRPNRDDSFRTMLEQVCEDILVFGAGAIEQETGSDLMRPLWLWPVDASSIEIYAAWDGTKSAPRYMQDYGYGNVGGARGIPLRNDQLIYIRKDPSTDNPFGVGCLEVAFQSITRLLATSDYAGNVAGNSQPSNMLQLKDMAPNQLDQFREWWRNDIEGQGQTPIIGGDEAFVHKLHGGTDDALYLKYQELLIREIATAFEINPGNLGVEHDVNRNTAEVGEDRDWQGAMIPLATNVASHINREAIEGRLGFSQIEFRFLGIDRDDEEMLASIHETYIKNNVLTPNEVREKLGRAPLESEWGDMLTVDMQLAIQAAHGMGQDLDPELQAKPDRKIKDDNTSKSDRKRSNPKDSK